MVSIGTAPCQAVPRRPQCALVNSAPAEPCGGTAGNGNTLSVNPMMFFLAALSDLLSALENRPSPSQQSGNAGTNGTYDPSSGQEVGPATAGPANAQDLASLEYVMMQQGKGGIQTDPNSSYSKVATALDQATGADPNTGNNQLRALMQGAAGGNATGDFQNLGEQYAMAQMMQGRSLTQIEQSLTQQPRLEQVSPARLAQLQSLVHQYGLSPQPAR